ncbi:MAG: response regulator, partial [Candidatus Sericytochromatia bacterium]
VEVIAPEAAAPSSDRDGRSLRVLYADDHAINRQVVAMILGPLGVELTLVENGREALDILKSSAFDIVLMDVQMPEMDGLTATRELRKAGWGRDLPVIMLTAKAMARDQQECLEAGANDYLAKPIDVDKLLSLVRVWMPR